MAKAKRTWRRRLWSDLPLLTKGWVTLIIPLIVLTAIIGSFYLIEKQEHEADSWIDHSLAVRESLQQLLMILADSETGVNGYLVTGDVSWLDSYASARRLLPTALSRLADLDKENALRRDELVELRTLSALRMDDLDSLLLSAQNGESYSPEVAQSLMSRGKATMDKLRENLSAIQADEDQLLKQRNAALEQVKVRIFDFIRIASILAVTSGLLSFVLMINGLVRRIRRLKENALLLENGQPLLPMPAGADEIGRLGETLQNVYQLLARRERDLRETSLFLENVIDLGPVVILRRRPSDLAVVFVSNNSERLLGYSPEELLGDSGYDAHIHPDDAERVRVEYWQSIAAKASAQETEYRLLNRDGSIRWVYGVARISYDAFGMPGDILGYVLDVTARKQAEMEARESKEEADRANRAKSEFLSRMSHELRTPLNAISGFSQLLQADPLPAEARDSVEHIRRAGDHLLQLINEVLDIARIESGRMKLSLEPVSLFGPLEEAVELIAPMAAQQSIRVHVDVPLTARSVMADRQRLKQALLNLLSNAVKYNRPEGEIFVSCILTPGNRCQIRVQDTGYGIRPEHLARLYVPFDRLGAEQTAIEGTGIGLSLTKRLAEAMNGAVGVESTVGVGSTFWLEFTRVADPKAETDFGLEGEVAAAAQVTVARSHTVLYIEDDLSNYALVEKLLQPMPRIRLLSAIQGQMGLDLARKHMPDLILLDLHLPDISGAEVLERLRREPSTGVIPVVVLSADATSAMQEQLLGAGADVYLTKPLNLKLLLSTINQALEKGLDSHVGPTVL